MRRYRVVLVLAGAAAVWWAAPLAVTAATAGGAVALAGTWRTANPAASVPASFRPTSVTFVGAGTAAVIGRAGIPGRCAPQQRLDPSHDPSGQNQGWDPSGQNQNQSGDPSQDPHGRHDRRPAAATAASKSLTLMDS